MKAATVQELTAALARIRALPSCADWPADLNELSFDPVRARLILIEVIRGRRQPAQRARQAASRRATNRAPLIRSLPLPLFDRKRAAAGDRDD